MNRPGRGYAAGDATVSEMAPPPPSITVRPDAAPLLDAVAEALNACERAGIGVRLAHGSVVTGHGYVLPVGDVRLASRWQVRTRLPHPDGHGHYGSDEEDG